jgi:hypothetical protein
MNTEKGNIFHHLDIKMMYTPTEWQQILDGIDLDVMKQKRKRIVTKQVIIEKANGKSRIR